jgi:cellulose synthase/poly-beta-1,6-N-acetylglucosamine synthase-like glycosyltransferase
MIAAFLFWLALGLIVYAYAGFPLVLLARTLLRKSTPAIRKEPVEPSVSMVIVAHNEAASIAAKIENVYALDYPGEKLEVVIASDGSNDGTNEIVADCQRGSLRLLALPRAGKIPALNAAVAQATGNVLVFSDANSMYAPDALRALVAPFADPLVGAVGGNQCYEREGAEHMASFGERLYWKYDRMLKTAQSKTGSMTAATGAMHAIRRELFRPVPTGVSDDYMTSTRAVASGYRLVFEPAARAYETVAPSERAEFSRKLRIIVRGLRGLWITRELFNPMRYGFYSIQLLSHKLLRWSICWLLLILFGSALLLYARAPIYRLAVYAQTAFYACAALGMALHDTRAGRGRLGKIFGVPFFFCLANYAALRAWVQVLNGRRLDVWDSSRAASSAQPAPQLVPLDEMTGTNAQ